MIKKLKIFCLVLILALLDAGYAAVPFKTTCLFTDRLCYVSGDAVFLSIKQLEADSSLGISESVIYVDLVDAGNRFICGEIFKLSQHCASGYLQIPDSVKTSDYFLRAYTYQSKIYSSQPILDLKKIYITNRFVQNEVANSIQGNNSQVVFSGTPKVDAKACFLNLTDTVFEKRTKVTASLQLTDNNKGDIIYGAFSVKAVTPCELAMNEWNETNNINANQTVDAGQLGYQETEKKA